MQLSKKTKIFVAVDFLTLFYISAYNITMKFDEENVIMYKNGCYFCTFSKITPNKKELK